MNDKIRYKTVIIKVGRARALKEWCADVFHMPTVFIFSFLKDLGLIFLAAVHYFVQLFLSLGYAFAGRVRLLELDSDHIDKE